MDGQKDEATRKYEREIRLGMSLLGVLALLFVGVLARRVWMENSQVSASTKKPIYLSRVERDELRAKSKPLPLFSVNASSRPGQAMSSRSAERAAQQAKLEQEAATIPDLQIDDATPEKPESQPATFLERDKPENDATESAVEPRENLNAKESASPITPAIKPDQTSLAGDPQTEVESDEDEEPRPSRFSGARNDSAEEADTPQEPSVLKRPNDDQPAALPEPPKNEETENVRKKADRNPWKRAGGETTSKPSGPLHTVVKGDTLKSIARDVFDDESRWREIYDLNRDQIGDDFGYLKLGIQLRLPPLSEEPPVDGDPAASAKQVRNPK